MWSSCNIEIFNDKLDGRIFMYTFLQLMKASSFCAVLLESDPPLTAAIPPSISLFPSVFEKSL
jgi:hypothetical protein